VLTLGAQSAGAPIGPLGAGRPKDTHLVVDDWVIIPIGANLRLE
jgi:hypothetical protein